MKLGVSEHGRQGQRSPEGRKLEGVFRAGERSRHLGSAEILELFQQTLLLPLQHLVVDLTGTLEHLPL